MYLNVLDAGEASAIQKRLEQSEIWHVAASDVDERRIIR
jgi:hypothetical protein